MNEIQSYMGKDFLALKRLWQKLRTTKDERLSLFKRFKEGIIRHMRSEEQVLFPMFEKRSHHGKSDRFQSMKRDHEEIRSMLEYIEEAIKTGQDSSKIEEELKICIWAHEQVEEDIFYPWFDESLNSRQRSRILKELHALG